MWDLTTATAATIPGARSSRGCIEPARAYDRDPVDAYEREYMAADEKVLHRQKATIPRWALGVTAGLPTIAALVAGLGLAIAGALPLLGALAIAGGGVLLAAILTLIMVVTGVTRTIVSNAAVHIQMGMSHVRIPMEEIEEISLGSSGERRVGIGVRKRLNGTTIFNMFGDNERAVKIRWAGHKGETILVCKEPDELVAAVHHAQKARPARVRVEVPESAEPEEQEVPASSSESEAERGA